MNVPEYAKRRGISPQAVRKAIASGRLVRSVTRDAEGRHAVDAALADVEWNQRTDPLKIHTHRELFAPPASALDFPEATRRLTAIVEADLVEAQRNVIALIPHAIEGAIAALRGSSGRNPTEAELALALCLEPEDPEDAAVELSCALQTAIDDLDRLPEDLAREAGRAAVLATKEASDGNEG